MLKRSEMLALCQEIKRDLAAVVFTDIREAGERRWVVTFSNDRQILIVACPPFNRFHLSTVSIAAHPTAFTRKVGQYLKGGVLEDVQMRVLNPGNSLSVKDLLMLDLCFLVKGTQMHLLFELFSSFRKVCLTDQEWRVLASDAPNAESDYLLIEKKGLEADGASELVSADVEAKYAALERQAVISHRVKQGTKQLLARLKKMQARLISLEEENASGTGWEKSAHEAELLKCHFAELKKGMKEIQVEDWLKAGEKVTIELDPSLEPQEQLKYRYKLSRKLKKRQELSSLFIKDLENEISKVKALVDQGSLITDEEALGLWETQGGVQRGPSVAAKKEKEHPFREFTTQRGRKIYVGKKDVDNDALTFRFAHGLDLWFHAANTPGSHVVLRVPKGEVMDEDSIQDALQLALHFSKARSRGEDEVVMTECKYVVKQKRAALGQVNLKSHQTLYVKLDPKRLQRLLGKKAS